MSGIATSFASDFLPAPNDGVAVETIGLRKVFRRHERTGLRLRPRMVPALDNLSLGVGRGECVAILGQNGSGKSTLIRVLSTLLIPDGGTARVFGYDVTVRTRAVRRIVNRVSVEASFFKRLSAHENLSYAARFYGMTPAATRAQIPPLLERIGFPKERAGDPMEALSRGMQQKVALARALLTSPVVLLLDEPTTGLDPRSKLEVQGFVREVRESHDATVILCTHDLAEAESLADRIGILDGGRLLVMEGAHALKKRYAALSLEDAFFVATGRALEPQEEEPE